MRKEMKGVIAGLLLVTAGCATGYQPQGFTGGYSDTRISADTFSVSFSGNALVSGTKASDLAMLRAAEVAAENDYPYFTIIRAGDHASTGSYTDSPHTNLLTGQVRPGSTSVYSKPGSNMIIRGLHEPTDSSLVSRDIINAMKAKYGI